MNLFLVFIGGGAGSVLRYLIGLSWQRTTTLPLATCIANVSACLVFALVVWLAGARGWTGPGTRLLLLTGFCGGLSTFSTFGYETFLLLKQGMIGYAVANMVGSTVVCTGIFYIFNRLT